MQRAERVLPPLLGHRAAEEDLVDDDPGAGLRHRGDTRDPRRLQGAELRPHDDLAVRSERDAALSWLFGVNPILGDRRPIDLIRLGRAEELMRAIRAERADTFA